MTASEFAYHARAIESMDRPAIGSWPVKAL